MSALLGAGRSEMADLDVFANSFAAGWGTITTECECGINYYEDERVGDFETGEYESLEKNPKARCVENISILEFEGTSYVECCECWKPRAEQIMKFIDGHSMKIAKYLNAERKRATDEAELMPEVSA